MGRQVSGLLGGRPVLILRFWKALRAMDLEDHKCSTAAGTTTTGSDHES